MTKKPRTAEEILILQHRRAKAAELAKKAVCIALVLGHADSLLYQRDLLHQV